MAWTNGTFLHKPKSKSDSHIGAKKNLDPKRGGKQGELARTHTCLKCIPKGWLVVVANTGNHNPICINMNVMHYLNMKVMCMTFMCKQHEYTYNIHV
jgi:hypothetical protein